MDYGFLNLLYELNFFTWCKIVLLFDVLDYLYSFTEWFEVGTLSEVQLFLLLYMVIESEEFLDSDFRQRLIFVQEALLGQ